MLPVLTPSEFVDLFNQTIEMAYPIVLVEGELRNFRISKDRWVYFDLVDDVSKIKCFGVKYSLPGPVEEGMVVKISAYPRLHHQFGFSLNFDQMIFSGEGTIKKAHDVLKQKLEKDGLFSPERKRPIPFPPETIGLITSEQSAAYKDFIKVLSARYSGISIELADVNVQGISAAQHVIDAIEWFNKRPELVDVIVITRGGGDADDLQAFSNEQVVRAVAASRIPTMVAIGHEVDVALAELAADVRASTPSNAAELLVPDKKDVIAQNDREMQFVYDKIKSDISNAVLENDVMSEDIYSYFKDMVFAARDKLANNVNIIKKLSPRSLLGLGYSIVRSDGKVVRSSKSITTGGVIEVEMADGKLNAEVI